MPACRGRRGPHDLRAAHRDLRRVPRTLPRVRHRRRQVGRRIRRDGSHRGRRRAAYRRGRCAARSPHRVVLPTTGRCGPAWVPGAVTLLEAEGSADRSRCADRGVGGWADRSGSSVNDAGARRLHLARGAPQWISLQEVVAPADSVPEPAGRLARGVPRRALTQGGSEPLGARAAQEVARRARPARGGVGWWALGPAGALRAGPCELALRAPPCGERDRLGRLRSKTNGSLPRCRARWQGREPLC